MVRVIEKQAKPNSHKRELIRSMSSVFEFEEDGLKDLPDPHRLDKVGKFGRVLKTKELETFTPRNLKHRGLEAGAQSKESEEEEAKVENLEEELEDFK